MEEVMFGDWECGLHGRGGTALDKATTAKDATEISEERQKIANIKQRYLLESLSWKKNWF